MGADAFKLLGYRLKRLDGCIDPHRVCIPEKVTGVGLLHNVDGFVVTERIFIVVVAPLI